MIELERVEAHRIADNETVLQWEFKPTADDLSLTSTKVFRSYIAAGQEEVELATVAGPVSHYRDTTVEAKDRWRLAYYRLEFSHPSTVTFSSPVFRVNIDPVPEAREALRLLTIGMRFKGVPVFLFKKRTVGSRYPDCWDSELAQVVDSECETCVGTGWLAGYYAPILTHMDIRPAAVETTKPEEISRQDMDSTAEYISVPRIATNDVIVELGKGLRWRVAAVTPSAINEFVVKQDLQLVAINLNDIEHKVLKLPSAPGQAVVRPLPARPIRYTADDVDPPVKVVVEFVNG